MQFDTNSSGDGDPPVSGGEIRAGSILHGELDLPAVSRKQPLKQTNDRLLSYLDDLFGPKLEDCRIQTKRPAEAPGNEPSENRRPELLSGPSAEDLLARDVFLNGRAKAPVLAAIELPGDSLAKHLKMSIKRALGAPVFIGFDAEWVAVREGRNRILSVQFHLVGPTGQRLNKVIIVANGDVVEARPSLIESINDLLDEAELDGIIEEWPSEIVLCGFFTRADLPVFRDAKKFIQQMQGINGSLATVGTPAKMDLPLSDARAGRLKARYRYVVGDGYNPCLLSMRLIDASRLAPPGTSLSRLGDWLGVPKLKLPAGYKASDMARLQRERPDFFRAYGLTDAEIAVLYVLWVLWFCNRHLGIKKLSATASGIGVQLAQLCMRRDGVLPDIALNFTRTNHTCWDKRTGQTITKKKREPTAVRKWLESFIADAFLGGRNENYVYGATEFQDESDRIYDHDLAGCYVVSLAGLMTLDYDRAEIVRERKPLRGDVAGFAQVRFTFPENTRFPCLPVMVGNYGLWFPLSGVSIATAPELELAESMGAEIEILFGVIIPWMDRDIVFERSKKSARGVKKKKQKESWLEFDGEAFAPETTMQFPPDSHGDVGYRPFESFSIFTRAERLKYARKSLPNEFMKLVGNSCYGKTGQGFKDKRAFGPKEMNSIKIGQSAISEAAVAAMTSGFARAVLGEILHSLPEDAVVVSATTDGLLVDVEQLNLSGPMCQRFQRLVDRVAPGTGMIELKHMVAQVVAVKTRLQLTGKMVPGHAPVVAKGGNKVLLDSAEGDEEKEKQLLSPEGQNAFVLDRFIHRYPGQIVKRPSMMSMRDQLGNDWDLQMVDGENRLNMEFDFKRRPVNPRLVRIESHGVEHLAFDTRPWGTVEEGEITRILFDRWRIGDDSRPGRCLKTMADWNDWQAYLALYKGNRARVQQYKLGSDSAEAGGVRLLPAPSSKSSIVRGVSGVRYARGKEPYLGIAIRTFLAAYVQRAWGLEGADLSQAKLAAWLTEMGYSVKPHDVKNAGRTQLFEQSVPSTPEVLAFFAVVKLRFPALEEEVFLAPSQ